jgi:hypothetical protein
MDQDRITLVEAILTLVLQVITCRPHEFEDATCLLKPYVTESQASSWSDSMARYMFYRQQVGGLTGYTEVSWVKIYIALMAHTISRPATLQSVLMGMNTFIDNTPGFQEFKLDTPIVLENGDVSMISSHAVGFFMLTCMLMPPTAMTSARVMTSTDVEMYLASIWKLLQEDNCLPMDVKEGFLAGPLVSILRDPLKDVLKFLKTDTLTNAIYNIVRSVGERLREDFRGPLDDEFTWPHIKLRMVYATQIIGVAEMLAREDANTEEMNMCRQLATDLIDMVRAKNITGRNGRVPVTVCRTFITSMQECVEGAARVVTTRGYLANMDFLEQHLLDTHERSMQELAADIHCGVSRWMSRMGKKRFQRPAHVRDILAAAVKEEELRRCSVCHVEEAEFLCGACECERYCGMECQRQGWRKKGGGDHRHKCLGKICF